MNKISFLCIFILSLFYSCDILTQLQTENPEITNQLGTIANPVISLESGIYYNAQQVEITCQTEGADFYYEIDGSIPTLFSTKYEGIIILDKTSILKVIAVVGEDLSSVVSKTYSFQVAEPTVTPNGDSYDNGQLITISSETNGSSIYYTLDGSIPDVNSYIYIEPFLVDQTTTVNCIATKEGYENSSLNHNIFYITPIIAPYMDITSGTYNNNQIVTLSCDTENATIYYTLNGDIPSEDSIYYSEPIVVDSNVSIKAVATLPDTASSAITEECYSLVVSSPTTTPEVGSYENGQFVTILSDSIESTIYYTTDGSTPTVNDNIYTEPFLIDQTTPIKSIAIKDGYENSSITTSIYTITPVTAPVVDVAAGIYDNVQYITLTCDTENASIFYTIDGDEPTDNSLLYLEPIEINANTTLKAMASIPNTPNSEIIEVNYEFIAAQPVLTPEQGSYDMGQLVSISSNTIGTTLYYTTDGSTPTVNDNIYTEPFLVDQTSTVKSIAVKDGYENSSVTILIYTIIPVSTPVADITPGIYNNDQNVTLTCSTDNASIYYTLNGEEPTENSFRYSESLVINSNITLKAIASIPNTVSSEILEVNYEFVTAQPIFTPEQGSYIMGQLVNISSNTDGATVYYTTDGSTPTVNDNIYTEPFLVDQTTTVKSIAVKDGYENSSVNTSIYTITPVTAPIADITAGIYDNDQYVTLTCSTENATIYYTLNGEEPTENSLIYSEPVGITSNMTLKAIASVPNTAHSEIFAANYEFVTAQPVFTPEEGSYNTGQLVSISSNTDGATFYYTTDGNIPTVNDNIYTAPILVDETATLKCLAVRDGYNDSSITTSIYSITPIIPPTISIPTGTYNNNIIVELSCDTPDAVIYYTIDGEEPGNNAILYTTPIEINSDTSLRAVATLSNTADSLITVGTYEFISSTPDISPGSGSYDIGQLITIESDTSDSTIYYTTNGETPTVNDQEFIEPFLINQTTTIKCISVKDGYNNSSVSVETLVINPVSSPISDVSSGTYSNDKYISLTSDTDNATIYYTVNGEEPTRESNIYNGQILINTNTILKAFAVRDNTPDSVIVEYNYNFKTSNPVVSLDSGTYEVEKTISLTCSTEGASIYYTLDGSTPDINSTIYSSAITIQNSSELRVITIKDGYMDSDIISRSYVLTGTGTFIVGFATPENESLDLTSSIGSYVLKSEVSTVVFSIQENFINYHWYLDSELQVGENSSVFNWDISSIEIGVYNITCIVESDGLYYSKEVKIRIIN